MPLIIKGILLDDTTPLVCVPITLPDSISILKKARELTSKGVNCIEWRADHYEDLYDGEKLRSTLEALRDISREAILIVTVRSKRQGGMAELSSDVMRNLLIEISRAHCADLIDMEFFEYNDAAFLIERLHENGALVIASHHDFEKTPGEEAMESALFDMSAASPDIVKLAVMPRSKSDVFSLMKSAAVFREKEKVPVIAISMGKEGVISRMASEAFGSCITFGCSEKESAPGQIDHYKLENILKEIHLCL